MESRIESGIESRMESGIEKPLLVSVWRGLTSASD